MADAFWRSSRMPSAFWMASAVLEILPQANRLNRREVVVVEMWIGHCTGGRTKTLRARAAP